MQSTVDADTIRIGHVEMLYGNGTMARDSEKYAKLNLFFFSHKIFQRVSLCVVYATI